MKVISTTNAPGAIGPYSQGFVANGMVFTSGQIPIDPATGEMPEGIKEQAEQSCRNVIAIKFMRSISPPNPPEAASL